MLDGLLDRFTPDRAEKVEWEPEMAFAEGQLVGKIPDSKSFRGELVGVETSSVFASTAHVLSITQKQIVLLSPSLFSSNSSESGHVEQVLPFSMPPLPESLSSTLGGTVESLQKMKKSTVVKVWDIKLLEKLKFKRANPGLLSLFFKDEELNILIPDILEAVEYIKLQMKNEYGIEGLHKSKQQVTAESFMERTQTLLKEFDEDPKFDLVKRIMALFREATERFSLLKTNESEEQANYISVVKSIQAFLNRADVVTLLEEEALAAATKAKQDKLKEEENHAAKAIAGAISPQRKETETALLTSQMSDAGKGDNNDIDKNDDNNEDDKKNEGRGSSKNEEIESYEIESELNDINAQFEDLMRSFSAEEQSEQTSPTSAVITGLLKEEVEDNDFSIEDFDSLMEQFSIK